MKKRLVSFVSAVCLLSAVGVVARPSQTGSSDAHLRGTVVDASSGGIGGVRVTAQLEGHPQADLWKATSTTDGKYDLRFPAGRYHVVFSRSPFTTREFVVELAARESRTLDLKMELETLSSRVVVTAEGVPQQVQQTTAPVTIISREEIDQRLAVVLPDVLLYTPGISISRTGAEGGTASIFINGGNSNFTKVLVDGTPVNEPGNAVDFSNFSLDNIDKVEVVRGAESAIYGTDAVSGVIQVFTHRGATRVPEFSLFSEGGSFSTARTGAGLSGKIGNFDYSGAASYFTTAGPHDYNHFLNRTLSGNFGYSFSDTNQLRLSVRNNTSGAQTPGQTVFTPPSPDSHTDYHFASSNARWNFATGNHWQHEISGAESYSREFDANPIQSFFATDPFAFCPQDPNSPNSVATAEFCDFTNPGSKFQYNRASLNAQTSYLLSTFSATAGYQYEVENGSLPFLSTGHVRRDNQAGFLDFHYMPHPRASISFGARAEANGNFGTRVVPRIGASLALLQGRGFWGETRFRLFYGEGIKEPRFDQLYDDQFGDIGNPSLKPEASKTWSVSLEQNLADNRARLTVEYFSNNFYDIVSFAFCSALPPPSTSNTCGIEVPNAPPSFGYFFNTDRARARGFNLHGEAKPYDWLRFSGTYGYDDSRVLESPNTFDPSEIPGNHLIRRPVNSGSLTATAVFRRASFLVAGFFSGERTDSDFLGLGLTRNPGYARFDMSASYEFIRGLSVYTRATNLFDKQYQDALGYPALGRDVRVGMKYRFGGRN